MNTKTKTKTQTFNERYRIGKAFVGAYVPRALKERAEERAAILKLSMTQLISNAIAEYLGQKMKKAARRPPI